MHNLLLYTVGHTCRTGTINTKRKETEMVKNLLMPLTVLLFTLSLIHNDNLKRKILPVLFQNFGNVPYRPILKIINHIFPLKKTRLLDVSKYIEHHKAHINEKVLIHVYMVLRLMIF